MDSLWLNLNPINSFKRKRDANTEAPKAKRTFGGDDEVFPLMELPSELRLHILSFTDLATPASDGDSDGNVELRMVGDRLKARRPFASTASDGLFLACRALRTEAIETLLSGNRLVLLDCDCEIPNPACAMLSLQSLTPRILRRVPNIELRLKTPGLLDARDKQDGYDQFVSEWEQLIKFIASVCVLSRLGLTIDASSEYDLIMESGIGPARLEKYSTFYKQLAAPLIHLEGLRRFRIFLACNIDLEDDIVAKVMRYEKRVPQEDLTPIEKMIQVVSLDD